MEPISNSILSLYGGTPQHGDWVIACLQGAWNGLLGEKVAKICRPLSVRQSELVVEVFDEPWMPALASMNQELLERVKTFAGNEIRRLTFVMKR